MHVTQTTEKWADFAIELVRYDRTNTYIDQLWVWTVDEDGTIKDPQAVTRQVVVRLIEQGMTFKTITPIPDSERFRVGALVEIVIVERVKFLKTTPNRTPKDNLGNLGTF